MSPSSKDRPIGELAEELAARDDALARESFGYADETRPPTEFERKRDLEKLQVMRAEMEATFGTPQGQLALGYIYDFCKANRTSFDRDPGVMAYKEGRRRVLLWLQEVLRLTDEEMYQNALNSRG